MSGAFAASPACFTGVAGNLTNGRSGPMNGRGLRSAGTTCHLHGARNRSWSQTVRSWLSHPPSMGARRRWGTAYN
jgi:hypothetical protein